jgi:S-adenosylmethionine:tRNA ribosyltransferase-isomerase
VHFSSATFTNRDGFRREKSGEIFFLREILPSESAPATSFSVARFEALVFPGAAFSTGSKIELGNFVLEVESKIPDGRTLRIVSGGSVHDFLAAHGKLPLPPYVEYSDEKARDYQTEFARKEGSLAAPTASLHFTERLISQIRDAGSSVRFLTLHVGL